MLTMYGRRAVREMKENGIKRAEALEIAEAEARRYNSNLTISDYKAIDNFKGVKAMKTVVKKTSGIGNNERIAFIKSVEYAKDIKVRPLKKAPKVSDRKDYKALVKDCKTIVEKYETVINNAESIEELEKVLGWIAKDSRLTGEEKSDLGWDVEATMWHMGQSGKETIEMSPKVSDSKGSKESGTKAEAEKKAKKKTAKKSTKKTAKKSTAKKETKAKKETPKKKETKAKKETPKVFILDKWEGNKLTSYQFVISGKTAKVYKSVDTMKRSRGFVVAGENLESKSGEMTTEKARRMYKALLNKGFAA